MKNYFEPPPPAAVSSDADSRLERVALLPIALYPVALFQKDGELLGGTFALWAFCVALMTPWMVFRTWRAGGNRSPRAAAVLALGAAPWLLFLPPTGLWLLSRQGLSVAFPFFYVWGAGAFAIVAMDWPPMRAAGRGLRLLVAGAVVWLLLALALLAVIARIELTRPGREDLDMVAGGLALAFGGGALFGAIKLTLEAVRAWSLRRA
ncbi:MAG: hypothetical protein JF588_03685 [Caulobacterales bacterium]|nr:hypothetical protein [Caulobacterales bacterium]